ncbi:MAG: aminoacyltransferase [Clostridia bacterium]|nr:aminoacyltransferase [Clostridia bacterium]
MLKVIDIYNCEQWDSIVKSFKDFDVYYLSGYCKAFYTHGDGLPLLFYYEDQNVRGINVVMKRDVADDIRFKDKIEKGKYFDFATPYGYGGWLIEGENSSELFKEYFKWCSENNIVCEFNRFHPVIDNQRFSKNYYEVIPLGETVCVDVKNKDEVWNNFTSKNRNVIRKAINNDIVIEQGLSKQLLSTFKNIYDKTMDKDNAESYYYFEDEFYDSILNDLKDNATIFYAKYNDIIIASSIIIYANDKLNYHLSGSLKEYSHLAPSNLLLSEVAKWGSDNEFASFHLGGGVGSKEDGLLHFKKSFSKGPYTRYSIGKKIFNESKYNELVSKRNDIEKNNFFPLYRG